MAGGGGRGKERRMTVGRGKRRGNGRRRRRDDLSCLSIWKEMETRINGSKEAEEDEVREKKEGLLAVIW